MKVVFHFPVSSSHSELKVIEIKLLDRIVFKLRSKPALDLEVNAEQSLKNYNGYIVFFFSRMKPLMLVDELESILVNMSLVLTLRKDISYLMNLLNGSVFVENFDEIEKDEVIPVSGE